MLERLSPEVLVASGGVIGTVLSRVITVIIRRNYSEATKMRKELRDEIAVLREDMKELHREVDTWKGKYYELVEENIALDAKCQRMKAEIGELREALGTQEVPTREEG